ncbi:unnamed protein product [Trypanosoma congolense IL3000]|uniref:WGS project CAEQ00000000 data, annotated contig 1951 n=1 Tax=Trypanosoma congolense (strain IL3000) TaxID=1068625 RepID=F9WAA7_TRYCI|nr:unnamed protein product [Trypanosoma congolense IL3000]
MVIAVTVVSCKNRYSGTPLNISKPIPPFLLSEEQDSYSLKKSKRKYRREGVVKMACLVNVIAVAILILLGFVSGQVEVAKDDNIEPFALLCRIYNVAKNPPINYVDLEEPSEIVKEIDALNASLVDLNGPNETDQVENSSGVQRKPTHTRETAVAQAMIKCISQKAHTILEHIRRVNATRDIESVKAEIAQVIFGEGK